jgi:Cof subfamily protein (haloacid dehalogenase superfamily)
MKYKLVALDLDGTLLSDNKILNASTQAAIKRAQDKGVIFTIATGRMYRGAVRYAAQLNIEIPIITYNGAVIKNPLSGEVHREFKVPSRLAMRAIDSLDGQPVLKYVFTGDNVITDLVHEWTDNYSNVLDVEMKYVDDVRLALDDDPIMVVFMVQAEMRKNISDTLRNTFGSEARITNSSNWFVDVLNPSASKSLALEQLAKSLGILRDEIIAVGDNLNDLEMIQYAGLGVAVANASDDLKQSADHVTKAECYLGVEEVIEEFCI